jgi:hypothetical protein
MIRFGALALTLTLSVGIASAGQGWYLLTPPSKDIGTLGETNTKMLQAELKKPNPSPVIVGAIWLDLSAPLRDWDHGGSFDSAAECEEYRLYAVKHTKKPPLTVASFSTARCIASDDPRLK